HAVLTLGNRPGAVVFSGPERAAGVRDQDLDVPARPVAVQQHTGAEPGHHTPTARSRSFNASSRWPSSRCRLGTLRRQPTMPKSSWSPLLTSVMLTAWPSSTIDNG